MTWVLFLAIFLLPSQPDYSRATMTPPPELANHITGIAQFAKPSPIITIPSGWFLMGTNRIDDDPFGLATQYDDTEFPQRRIWLDAFSIDQYEVTLAEFLVFLHQNHHPVSKELQELIWHLISVHFIPDQVLAPWPALYVTWTEASDFCQAHQKRLPTEAEWEKAARGDQGHLFPWGQAAPSPATAVFGAYHVHQIPLVAAVDSWEEGQSPYGIHHMAGNIGEWVHDWFGPDYYAIGPRRNPQGPKAGRYKSVRGGSWKSRPQMLRTATRGGAYPNQREATIGFRCAQSAAQTP
ncbi:MAG: SUMF1/EgtB/PvdO family nonheme iron enzyme [Nitrospirales bacterium]|nr:SUMF1/EgtB/PvdO family nonheme iron enzyme [Nitrospirales bacterium]